MSGNVETEGLLPEVHLEIIDAKKGTGEQGRFMKNNLTIMLKYTYSYR